MEVPSITVSGFCGPLDLKNCPKEFEQLSKVLAEYDDMTDFFHALRWVRNFQCEYMSPPEGYRGAIFSAGPETPMYLLFVSEVKTGDNMPEVHIYTNGKDEPLNTCAEKLTDWIARGHRLWQLISPQLPELA